MDVDEIERILADWQERRDRGEPVSPADVLRGHPDLVAPLGGCGGIVECVTGHPDAGEMRSRPIGLDFAGSRKAEWRNPSAGNDLRRRRDRFWTPNPRRAAARHEPRKRARTSRWRLLRSP